MANNTAIRGHQIRDEVADNGLTKNADGNFQVLAGKASGASNEADVIAVSPNGIAVAVDDVSLGENGSSQLYIKPAGVGATELDVTDTYDFTISGAGTILVNDPTSDNEVANKAYVDAVAQGLDVKAAVVVMADSNITLANEQTIDGIGVVAGDRVLCTGQTDPIENCIWVVVDGGAWTRPDDFAAGQHASGAFCFIQQGNTYEDQGWVQTKDDISGEGDVIGTDALAWTQFNAATAYTAGAGIDITTNIISVDLYATKVSTAGDSDVANNPVYLDTTNGLNIKVDASTIDLDGSNANRLYVPNGGITETQLNTTVAGDGLTGGGGSALAVGAGVGLGVDANSVYVVPGVGSGASNVADVIVATADGVSVAVDESTIDENGSGQLEVVDDGITEPKLAIANSPSDGQVLGWNASGTTMVWIDNETADAVTESDIKFEDRSSECDKVTVAFVLANLPVDNSLQVFLNGLLQQEGAGKDYVYTSGDQTVTFSDAPHTNDILLIHYIEKDT